MGPRARLRRLAFGLATVTGAARRGFFIPYRYAGGVRAIDYPALVPYFEAAEAAFQGLIGAIEGHAAALEILEGPGPAPRFGQGWFPRLDAAAAYALVRHACPSRIIEVGSGHSTRFLARAVADEGLTTTITCIDPAPRARLDGLAVTHLPLAVQDAPAEPFQALEDGDVLFIDSSHVLMPGSDVDVLLNRILPALRPGVLVHFHDVFLPDPYPETWAWRGYNEQAAIACLLQGGGFAIRFASHWVVSRHAGRLRGTVLERLPRLAGAPESSLWLEKRR